jgi:hypothetical protein
MEPRSVKVDLERPATPTGDHLKETTMHTTDTVPNRVTLKRSTLGVLLVGAVLVTGAITGSLFAAVDSETSGPPPATPTNSEILDRLSPSAREYVEGIMNMTPAQLAAAYGHGPLPAPAGGND